MIDHLTTARGRQPAMLKQVHLLLTEADRLARRMHDASDKPSNWIELWIWASERAHQERSTAMRVCARTELNRIIRNRPRRRRF